MSSLTICLGGGCIKNFHQPLLSVPDIISETLNAPKAKITKYPNEGRYILCSKITSGKTATEDVGARIRKTIG